MANTNNKMSPETEVKINALCALITKETRERLTAEGLGCEANLQSAFATYKDRSKYVAIDQGGSGKYMYDKADGVIYGIKGYGVIHRGHTFGTLDTINQYNWGGYRAYKKGN